MSSPNFLCIGLEKTGTTWLYYNLKKNPDIFLPELKEIRFFWERYFLPDSNLKNRFLGDHWHYKYNYQYYFKKRLGYYLVHKKKLILLNREFLKSLLWDFKYLFMPHDISWYRSLFDQEQSKICGDITPLYYQLPETEVARLSKEMPDLKIVILLRDPIERAWSKAKMSLCQQTGKAIEQISDQTFYDFFKEVYDDIPSYINLIKLWEKYYERVFVGFYDEIQESPSVFLNNIASFLECPVVQAYNKEELSLEVNRGIDADIPEKFTIYLANMFHGCISELCKHYEGYPELWSQKYKSFLPVEEN